MKLIPCPDCKTLVSDEAKACPKCGKPITPEIVAAAVSPKKKHGCLTFIAFFLVLIGGVSIAVWANNLQYSSIKTADGNKLKFEDVGYSKSDNSFRVFTVYVRSEKPLSAISLPQDVIKGMVKYAGMLAYTEGRSTYAYFYLKINAAPSFGSTTSFKVASDSAANSGADFLVLRLPDGTIQANVLK